VRISRDLRVNHEIRAREVRLVDDDGRQIGIVPLREALRMAAERGLDLVEVAATANPPVCRILDYGRYKYEQEKREREARKKQHIIQIKELVLSPKIADHDLMILARKGERFLREGDKVKLIMRFRGREITHPELGREVFGRLQQQLAAVGQVESEPRLEGRTMVMVLTPRPEVLQALRQQQLAAASGAGQGQPPRQDTGS
jgi:translation initiation factor IF-3